MTPAMGDIDGDGRDEAMLAIGNTLFAVGTSPDKKAGVLRWSLSFPDRLGPAAIADTIGKGHCGDRRGLRGWQRLRHW